MTNKLLIEYNDHETLTINLLQPCFSVLRYTQDIFEREGVGGTPLTASERDTLHQMLVSAILFVVAQLTFFSIFAV